MKLNFSFTEVELYLYEQHIINVSKGIVVKATTNTVMVTTPIVIIEHKGVSLEFVVSVFGRTNFQKDICVFHHIDEYWASLPEAHQDAIFAIYKDIHDMFDKFFNNDELFKYLSNRTVELLNLHNLDHVRSWLGFRTDVNVPVKFSDEFTASVDSNNSKEKTYTKSEYFDLITLSLVLRCMIPIWGEYISSTRQETGTRHKEFYAFQLLNESNLNNSVPMIKLYNYVEAIVGPDKYNNVNILNGISSECFGRWLLSLVCVRRLCVGDIRGADPLANLCTSVYNFTIQKLNNPDTNPEQVIKPKIAEGQGNGADHDKTSMFERYRISADLSPGSIVELEYSMRDMNKIAYQLCSHINPDALQSAFERTSVINHEKIGHPQLTLLRWVFKPVISPRGVLHLPKHLIVQALAVTECVLWARNHRYLAILASSFPINDNETMMVSPIDHRKRIPADLEEQRDKIYPYIRATGSKSNSQPTSLAAQSVNILAENISANCWRPTANEDMVHQVFGNTIRKLPIHPDIKTDITKLIIEIGNRSWI